MAVSTIFSQNYKEGEAEIEAEEFQRMDDEFENFKKFKIFFDQRRSNHKSSIRIENLELFCNRNFIKFFDQKILTYCPKRGAWQKRANHLLGDLKRLKKNCFEENGTIHDFDM